METILYILHVLVCLGLLPIILLQSGKGGGVSAVFGGGGAGTVFGSRGASTFLTRMTTGAAILFMFTSMGLSYYSSQTKSVVGDLAPAAEPDRVGEEAPSQEASDMGASTGEAPAPSGAEQVAPPATGAANAPDNAEPGNAEPDNAEPGNDSKK